MSLLSLLTAAQNDPAPPAPPGRMGRMLAEARRGFDRLRHDSPQQPGADLELLRRFGAVVWAALVDVCNSVAESDAHLLLLYSVDEAFADDPAALVDIGRWIKSVKETGSADPRAQTLRRFLGSAFSPGACISLPLDLVDGKELYVATASWRRSGLPGSRLVDIVLPVVVMPEATAAVGVLPLPCWPQELVGEWLSAGTPETRGVERRIEIRAAPAWTAEEVLTRYRASPVRITPAAADALRTRLTALALGPGACVRITLDGAAPVITCLARANGGMEFSRHADLLLAVPARREFLIALADNTLDHDGDAFTLARPPASPLPSS